MTPAGERDLDTFPSHPERIASSAAPVKSFTPSPSEKSVNVSCYMCFLSGTCEGRAHEKSMADLAGYTLPPGSGL